MNIRIIRKIVCVSEERRCGVVLKNLSEATAQLQAFNRAIVTGVGPQKKLAVRSKTIVRSKPAHFHNCSE